MTAYQVEGASITGNRLGLPLILVVLFLTFLRQYIINNNLAVVGTIDREEIPHKYINASTVRHE